MTIAKHRCRWAGHVVRMEDTRLPKRVFFGELSVRGSEAEGVRGNVARMS